MAARIVKKVAAPVPAKKVAVKRTVKKTPAKVAAPSTPAASDDPMVEIFNVVIDSIEKGYIDTYLSALDSALLKRYAIVYEAAKTLAKKTTVGAAKTVPAPVRGASTLSPEVGKTYAINSKHPTLGGARVKFLRYQDGDSNKSVVEMLVSKGGKEKGTNIRIDTRGLVVINRVARKK